MIITDGDNTARKTVEKVGHKLGLRTISKSAGTPTNYTGQQIVDLIKEAPSEVALVMFDDEGDKHKGSGEEAMEVILAIDEIEVLGVLAVASNTKDVVGIKPDLSLTNQGEVIDGPVTKDGSPEPNSHLYLEGDTVDIINKFDQLLIVGIGDIGKMNNQDRLDKKCPVTTKAIEEILIRSGKSYEGNIQRN